MATKEARGTKRSCQNAECGSRFYDLNRDPITCPVCGSRYVIASAPRGAPAAPADEPTRKPKVPEFADAEAAAPEDAPEVESTEALAEIEAVEEGGPAEEDETFLEEEEEDGGDVSGILGPVAEDQEEA